MSNSNEKKLNIIRWIARIWSLLPILFALGNIFMDDPYATEPIDNKEYILLALLGIYVIGLLIAWKWDYIGGLTSTITFAVFLILFWIFVGPRIEPPNNLSILAVFLLGALPPALLFLYYGCEMKKGTQE
jgi:hypothetical protein